MNVNNDTEERYHHSLPIQIRFNDVDRYGHVNNNSYFAYYDLGKEEYLRNVLKVDYRKSEVVPVIANINADFIQPIFYDVAFFIPSFFQRSKIKAHSV